MTFDLNINTCLISSYSSIRVIAYYTHIIPLLIMLPLASMVFIKAKKNLLSKIFLTFVIVFALWLLGDLITWTSGNYYLIYSAWSNLVYLEIVFYILGFYFAIVFFKKSDINSWQKLLLFSLTLIPFLFTIFKKSVAGFDYSSCLAFNNNFLDSYKLYLEIIILGIIFLYIIMPFLKKSDSFTKKSHLIVLGSLFIFLSTFGITEYISAVLSNYIINLYSLILLPFLLIAMIYAVFELDIFNVEILGTHYLVIGFVILTGGQLFFIENTTNQFLTILAMLLAGGLSFILFKNLKKEYNQRIEIEKLNFNLHNTIKQRESLMHLVTHKVKGSFTRSKYIFSGILDGSFGEANSEIKKVASQGFDSNDTGIKTIDLVLNSSNLQRGTVKFEMKKIDIKNIVMQSVSDKNIQIETHNLILETKFPEEPCEIMGDTFWLKEAINNLIDNAIKYTLSGSIYIELKKESDKIVLVVRDTGVGINDDDKQILFTEGGRGKDSMRVNVDSTGYGLYSVKLIAEAHKGRVFAESEGENKGATFFFEIPIGIPNEVENKANLIS